ncbi:hypothetical protein [Paludibaculum fermentans]|uniref:Uncharacterized protein n=1 Tax=Paludibaculum fermentans TaxID=1473598 RepID=A0A7S7NN69_PALFE|nr:hypothetical protein [Paludibaculum fermentans]QOY86690.1 hypothetical protein IRI77_28465 [Paludibaculum fermentans]
MLKFTAFLLMALAVFAADDPWTKVSAVKSGTELRILKRGSKQPVLAKMDELTESSLIVIVKNEQVAIPREEIERIDARPAQAGSRVTKETKTSREVAGARDAASPKPNHEGGPSSSSSSSVAFGSKAEFETIYTRLAPAPMKR